MGMGTTKDESFKNRLGYLQIPKDKTNLYD